MDIKTLAVVTTAPLLGAALTVTEWMNMTVKINQSLIRTQLNGLFPIEGQKWGIQYLVDQPDLKLKAGGEVVFGAEISIRYLGRNSRGRITLSAWPEYREADSAFYLSQLKVVQLDWLASDEEKAVMKEGARQLDGIMKMFRIDADKINQVKSETLASLVDFVQRKLSERLSNRPIYQLDAKKHSHRLAALTISNVSVDHGTLNIEMSWLKAFRKAMGYTAFILAMCMLGLSALNEKTRR
ncbi:MAG: DUF1439 domain-containing protein [Hahellaceae bacterium]|nr:DUF1439 domain-containing protein [Hahellaceae bacterium]MCP5168960.1 DUF1439 domain-containing protein [Hahellaceae bacterium]